jgi:hypothetical protein
MLVMMIQGTVLRRHHKVQLATLVSTATNAKFLKVDLPHILILDLVVLRKIGIW